MELRGTLLDGWSGAGAFGLRICCLAQRLGWVGLSNGPRTRTKIQKQHKKEQDGEENLQIGIFVVVLWNPNYAPDRIGVAGPRSVYCDTLLWFFLPQGNSFLTLTFGRNPPVVSKKMRAIYTVSVDRSVVFPASVIKHCMYRSNKASPFMQTGLGKLLSFRSQNCTDGQKAARNIANMGRILALISLCLRFNVY